LNLFGDQAGAAAMGGAIYLPTLTGSTKIAAQFGFCIHEEIRMSVRKVLMVCVVAMVALLPLTGCGGKKTEPAKGTTPAASGAPAADAPAAGETSNTTDGE
jgi:hypothetical protein